MRSKRFLSHLSWRLKYKIRSWWENLLWWFRVYHHITYICYFVESYLFSLWYDWFLWRCFVLLLGEIIIIIAIIIIIIIIIIILFGELLTPASAQGLSLEFWVRVCLLKSSGLFSLFWPIDGNHYYYYYYLLIEIFFTSALADGLSLEFKRKQIFLNLQDSSQYSGHSQ